MLQESTLQAAQDLAREITDKGFVIKAEPGTPIQEILDAGRVEYQLFDPKEQALLSDRAIDTAPSVASGALDEAAAVQALAENPFHDEKMSQSTAFLADAVSAHLDFACNVVLEAARSLTVQVEHSLAQTPAFTPGVSINQVILPELLFNHDWVAEISSRSTGSAIRIVGRLQVGSKSVQDIISMCKTGSGGLDAQVLAYLASMTNSEIDLIYRSFFKSIAEMSPSEEVLEENLSTLLEKTESRKNYSKYALLVYLIARSLYVNPDQDLMMSLDEARNLCLDYMNLAAGYQLKAIALWQSDINNNVVVVSLDPRAKSANVNKITYGNYLNAGGSADVVCGVLAQGNTRVSTAQDLQKVGEDALKAWELYKRTNMAQTDNMRLSSFQAALIRYFDEGLKEMGEDESSRYNTDDRECFKQIQQKAEEFASKLTMTDLQSVPRTCLAITAQCRFFYTDAYRILSDIDDFCSSTAVKEAALKTVINLVVDFMVDQLYREAIGGSVSR